MVFMLATSTTLHSLKDPSFVHINTPIPGLPRFVSKELVVSPDESGMRLDRFLLSRLSKDHPSVNHVNIQKWLRKRQIKKMAPVLDQTESEREEEVKMKAVTVTAGATRTETGQIWRIRLLEAVDQSVEAMETAAEESDTSLPLQDWIVYKDDRIIVLNKPAGVAVQGGTGVQSSVDSSLSVLQFEYQNRPKIVHRLDKTTSGLLVLARTRKAAQDLAKRFHDGSTGQGEDEESGIQKKYIAIVHSKQPLDIPVKDSLTRLNADMMTVVRGNTDSITIVDGASPRLTTGTVWPSATDVRVVSQSMHAGDHWALLHLYPKTGRKHQLRVHCAQLLNAPILGDEKYSRPLLKKGKSESSRIHLHMSELVLKNWAEKTKDQEAGSDSHGKQKRGRIFFKTLDDNSLLVRAVFPADMKAEMVRLGLK
ncbi:hypothetical protein MVEG_04175 [Podila verticillata NRRL 6337]|nr:hypothetical protein MVEG_04175 [Podila verticillata NRRL 6337]